MKWPLDGPFIVLLEQDGTHETDDGVLVGKDVDDVGAPLDLQVDRSLGHGCTSGGLGPSLHECDGGCKQDRCTRKGQHHP